MKTISIHSAVLTFKLLILTTLVGTLYCPALQQLISHDWNREDYNYAWIIPVLIIYLIWDNRKAFSSIKAKPSWSGIIILAFGLSFYLIGELAGEYLTLYLSFTVVLTSLCWVLFGWQKLKTILFPLLLTLAMYPPPNFLHNKLTFSLKLMSSELGMWFLQVYGMSAYREGNIIDLGFTQLQVVDACSGLRYLFPLIIMAVLLAYFYKAALWKKIVLVISAVPLTIVTNAFRIAATGILYEFFGSVVADDFFHGFSGWFIFMFGLGVLLFEMWVLRGFKPMHKLWHSSGGITKSRAAENVLSTKGGNSCGKVSIFQPPQYIVAVCLLGLVLASMNFVDFRQKIPSVQPFGHFPVQLEGWSGKNQLLEKEIVDTLNLTDYFMRNYRNSEGKLVNAYSAYYESQTKGRSIHSPATCLPGAGWDFEIAGTVEIPVPNGDSKVMHVNRALMIKGDSRQLSYYWFPQRDRILTSNYQLKWFNFWDALTRQRTDGALVRLITPLYPGEDVDDGDVRLTEFSRRFVPVLNEFLPVAGSLEEENM